MPPPAPSLVGAYYLHPPDARAIFLHNDLLCNGTCSVTGGTNGKDPISSCMNYKIQSIGKVNDVVLRILQ